MKRYLPHLLVVLMVYLPGRYLRPGLPALHLEDGLIILGAAYLFFSDRHCISRTLFNRDLSAFTKPYVLLLSWLWLTSLSMAFGTNPITFSSVVFKLISMLRPVLLIIILFTMLSSKKSVSQYVTVLVAVLILQLVVMFCQKYNYLDVNTWLTPRYSLVFESSLRTDGTFGNPNHASVAIVPLGMLVCSYAVFGIGSFYKRLLAGLLTATTLFFMVVVAGSRTGAAGFLTGILAIILVNIVLGKKRNKAFVFYAGIAIIGLILGWYQIAGTPIGDRFSVLAGRRNVMEDLSFSERTEVWKNGWDRLSDADLFIGRGLGDFMEFGIMDSGYVSYLYIGGLGLVLIFLIMTIYPSWRMFGYVRRRGVKDRFTYIYITSISLSLAIVVCTISHALLLNDKIWILYISIHCMAFSLISKVRFPCGPVTGVLSSPFKGRPGS